MNKELLNGVNLITFKTFQDFIFNINKGAYTEYHLIVKSDLLKNPRNNKKIYYFSINTKQYINLKTIEKNENENDKKIKESMRQLIDNLFIIIDRKAFIVYDEKNHIKQIKMWAHCLSDEFIFIADNTPYQYKQIDYEKKQLKV